MHALSFVMLELQETIAKVQSATASLRRGLADRAVGEYFTTLDLIGSPTTGDFEAAQARANAILKQELLSADSMAPVNGDKRLDDDSVATIALGFDAIARPLRTPLPVAGVQVKSFTLALAGAGGALGGMLLGAALMRLVYDMRDLGLAIGGPLGALLAVLLVSRMTRARFLAKVLPWLFVKPKTVSRAVRSEHEKAVRIAIEQWLDWAIPMLAILCLNKAGAPQAKTDKDKALRRLGKLIYLLHQAQATALPVVAHELIQEAKNSGFEGLEGQPAFLEAGSDENEVLTWSPDLAGRYEAFGHIAEGDRVTVERPAVIFGGRVVQKGLVRKVRDKA